MQNMADTSKTRLIIEAATFFCIIINTRYTICSGLIVGSILVLRTISCYGLGGPGIESRWGRDFLHLSRLTLVPI
jgi:hypothetical protein